MFREKRTLFSSVRLGASVTILLLGAAVSAQADINVSGTFSGTFYTGPVPGGIVTPIDTQDIFGTPGANLTGVTFTGTFSYDASQLPLYASQPGYTEYNAPNNGFVTETVNGVTLNIGTNVYMDLALGEPPYLTAANVYDLEAANFLPVNFVAGDNYAYQYVRLEVIGEPFLNGLGNVQQFSAAPGTAGGVDLFESYTYNPTTGSYISSVEELPFTLTTFDVTATPEPGMLPVLCMGFACLGILFVRRRKAA